MSVVYILSHAPALSAFILQHTPFPQIAKTLSERISRYCQVVLDSCAYAGTGNVLKVQELLALCGEHIETTDDTAWKVRGPMGGAESVGERQAGQLGQGYL